MVQAKAGEAGFQISASSLSWKPDHDDLEYPPEFIKWINSINSGWQNKISYRPFEMYVREAEDWLEDKTEITDFDNAEDQLYWLMDEVEKIKQNSLYFCNKYGRIKNDKAASGLGYDLYTAWEAQQVLLFLCDCGYSTMIGKARQIGFTTTMCLMAMKRVNFMKSYFIKFVTSSEIKGIEIFRDKVKWAYTKLPDYLAEAVKNWTDKEMNMNRSSSGKGREDGSASRFQVDTPAVDAINGGSPSWALIDEIGLIKGIFGEMMREGRPALFKFDPAKGKLVMQQQFTAWGTGGEMDQGGAVFEAEFKNALKQWRKGNYEYGIIPLFFNAYARPGVDAKFLEKEKQSYMADKDSKGAQISKVQFHQAYPITIEHMFLRKARTMVSIEKSTVRLTEIYSECDLDYGYLEPIYDQNQPTPDLFVPYKIIGAKFVKTEEEDLHTTVCIFRHPEAGKKWRHRYYSGVDPINSETGHSKFSTSIWDSLVNECSASLFARERDFRYTYLQSMLLRIYYDQLNIGGIKELTENNIGDTYIQFQESLKFKKNIVANMSLYPDYFRKPAGKWFGISNKVDTAPRIMAKMEEMIESYGDNINIPWFWKQSQTFVEKDLSSSNSHRQTRYQAADLRHDYDDVLFSMVIAYINAQSHAKFEPVDESVTQNASRVKTKYVQSRETNFVSRLAQVDENGRILKFLR